MNQGGDGTTAGEILVEFSALCDQIQTHLKQRAETFGRRVQRCETCVEESAATNQKLAAALEKATTQLTEAMQTMITQLLTAAGLRGAQATDRSMARAKAVGLVLSGAGGVELVRFVLGLLSGSGG